MLRHAVTDELAAAAVVAARAGLGTVRPELLHLGNHTSIRLKPWPIVARVASGTSFDFFDNSIRRELEVAAHLEFRGAPAVRPSNGCCPGPYIENDCAVTLWEFVEGRAASCEADELIAAVSLDRLHSSLADITVALPSFIEKIHSCETILSNPAEAPKLAAGDRHFLRALCADFWEKLGGFQFRQQPLHGDPHLGNVLIGKSSAIWMDLEAACLGPREWDVASLPSSTWPSFAGIDVDFTAFLGNVRSCCVCVWCWAEFDRSAAAAEAATYHLDRLKLRFG